MSPYPVFCPVAGVKLTTAEAEKGGRHLLLLSVLLGMLQLHQLDLQTPTPKVGVWGLRGLNGQLSGKVLTKLVLSS